MANEDLLIELEKDGSNVYKTFKSRKISLLQNDDWTLTITGDEIDGQVVYNRKGNDIVVTVYGTSEGETPVVNKNQILGTITLTNIAKTKDSWGYITATVGLVTDNMNIYDLIFAEDYTPTKNGNTYTGTFFNETANSTDANETFILGSGYADKVNFTVTEEGGKIKGFGKDTIKLGDMEAVTLNFTGINAGELSIEKVEGSTDLIVKGTRTVDGDLGQITIKGLVDGYQINFSGENTADVANDFYDLLNNFYEPTRKGNKYVGTIFKESVRSTSANETFVLGTNQDEILFKDNEDKAIAFGKDTVITEPGEIVDLQFAAGTTFDYSKSGNHLVIKASKDDELGQVTINDYFKNTWQTNVSINYEDIQDLLRPIEGIGTFTGDSSKKNTLIGNSLDNTMTGGNNNDIIKAVGGTDNLIIGGEGSDKLYAALADKRFPWMNPHTEFEFDAGHSTGKGDFIYDATDNDLVTGFAGLADYDGDAEDHTGTGLDGVKYTKSGNNLVLSYEHAAVGEPEDENYTAAYTDKLTIVNYFKTEYAIDDINNQSILSNIVLDFKGKGKLAGTDFADKFNATGKATITTGTGTDTIKTSNANDTIIIDGEGTKIINFSKESGGDTINIVTADAVTIKLLSGTETVPTSVAYKAVNNKDLLVVATYADESASITQTTTIKNYFTTNTTLYVNSETAYDPSIDGFTFVGEANKANTIIGTDYKDIITGGNKADKITTGAGNDTVNAGKSNDTITINGTGAKEIDITAGDGNDVVIGASKADSVNFVFSGYLANYVTYIKSGNDLIISNEYGENPAKLKNEYVTVKDYFKGEERPNITVKYGDADASALNFKADGNNKLAFISNAGIIKGTEYNDLIIAGTKTTKIDAGDGKNVIIQNPIGKQLSITAGINNDTYEISDFTKSVDITDKGGNDVLDIQGADFIYDDIEPGNLVGVFDVLAEGVEAGKKDDLTTLHIIQIGEGTRPTFKYVANIHDYFNVGDVETAGTGVIESINGDETSYKGWNDIDPSSDIKAFVNDVRETVSAWLTYDNRNYKSAYEALADTKNANYAANMEELISIYQQGSASQYAPAILP